MRERMHLSDTTSMGSTRTKVVARREHVLQWGVPATSLLSPFISAIAFGATFMETPKSDSLTLPFFVVRIFAALRSQWITSELWR